MKAINVKSPGSEFALEEIPTPVPGPGEILVKVDSVAICHTDLVFREGLLNDSHSFPIVPGHEFSGEIVAVGENVTSSRIGDRGAIHTIIRCHHCAACRKGEGSCENMLELGSTLNGAYAEYCVMPEACFLKLNDQSKVEEASLTEPLANAVAAASRAQIKRGDIVVVIGPGAIGLMASKVARLYHPSQVILVGTRDSRLEVGKQYYGVDDVINIRKDGEEERLINEVLHGKGADVIIDCSGSLSGFELSLSLLKSYSRIIFEGFVRLEDTTAFSPRILHENCSLLAVEGWSSHDFQTAFELIDSGWIDVKPLITHCFSLEQWEDGFETAANKKSESIRVLLKPQWKE